MYEHDFCEYAVRKKAEGAYLAALCAAAALALLFAAVFFLFLLPALGLLWSAVILAAAGALLWYLSRFTAIEYEYTLTGSIFDAAAVYNRQYRREKLSVDLKKSARRCAPYQNGRFEGGLTPKKIHDLRSSKRSACAYALVYEANRGCEALLFDASARMIDCIWRVIPSVTVRSDNLPEL